MNVALFTNPSSVAAGNKAETGARPGLQEHVEEVFAMNAHALPNPSPSYSPTGEFLDALGPVNAPGQEHTYLKTEQTFTAYKGGEVFQLSTKVNQYVDVTNRTVHAVVIVIVP
jgi:hypothetical protein